MFPLHGESIRAIGHLHASVSPGRQPRYGCPMPFSVITSCTGTQFHTYIPPTHIHFKTLSRPLDLQGSPDIQIHPTPSPKSFILTAVRHQGSRFDPSRCSSFYLSKLFRWLVVQSYIVYQPRPCLSHCSIEVNGISSNAANDSTGHHLLVLDTPLRNRNTSHHPSPTTLSVPPLQQTFQKRIGCAVLGHQQSIPPTLLAHIRKSAGNWIIPSLYPLAAALRHVSLRCRGSGMLVVQNTTLRYKTEWLEGAQSFFLKVLYSRRAD